MKRMMHIVIDLLVELGGLLDTSDVQLLGYNVGEHVAVAPVVDSMLRSLAVEALVLADWRIAFSVDPVEDMQKYVVDSQFVIAIAVGIVVLFADVHKTYRQLDMDQLVHSLSLPIQDQLEDHVDQACTYFRSMIGMMNIVAVVAKDVDHDVVHTRQEDPLVLVRLHRIDSRYHSLDETYSAHFHPFRIRRISNYSSSSKRCAFLRYSVNLLSV
jgi:hypothetical protein